MRALHVDHLPVGRMQPVQHTRIDVFVRVIAREWIACRRDAEDLEVDGGEQGEKRGGGCPCQLWVDWAGDRDGAKVRWVRTAGWPAPFPDASLVHRWLDAGVRLAECGLDYFWSATFLMLNGRSAL
jgi:hypothetical protein